MDKYELLEKSLCKELDEIEHGLKSGSAMTTQDLDRIDKLVHAMKSLATYKAMKDAEGYEDNNMSKSYTASNANRHMSYADGYSRGYAEAMNQMQRGNSGHYPPWHMEPSW